MEWGTPSSEFFRQTFLLVHYRTWTKLCGQMEDLQRPAVDHGIQRSNMATFRKPDKTTIDPFRSSWKILQNDLCDSKKSRSFFFFIDLFRIAPGSPWVTADQGANHWTFEEQRLGSLETLRGAGHRGVPWRAVLITGAL